MTIGPEITYATWILCTICALYLLINKMIYWRIELADRCQTRIQGYHNHQVKKGLEIDKLIDKAKEV